MRVLRAGEVIRARTHAELLNEVFGTDYKAWMQCTWKYSYDTIAWMVRFNEVNPNAGWENVEVSPDHIVEINHFNVDPVVSVLSKKRIVFQIVGDGVFRKYIFKGIFKYEEQDSNPRLRRHLVRIDDTIIIK